MALKTFKSYTKSTRGTVLVNRKDLWKGKPLKSLSEGKTKIVRGKKSSKSGYKKAIVTLKKGQSIDLATGV